MSANTYLKDEERQILESATVGIAGAGGLGSNCAAHLVRAGLKRLVIADFDVVSKSNLNRQFFFRDQFGLKKVDALSENLRRIEPDLDLVLHDVRLTPVNARPTFENCQIIVEALDSADVKSMLLGALLPMETHRFSERTGGLGAFAHDRTAAHRQEPHPDRRHDKRHPQRSRPRQPARRHRRRNGGQRRRCASAGQGDLKGEIG